MPDEFQYDVFLSHSTKDKASLLTPDLPPIPAVMTATASTRSRSLAPGQMHEDSTFCKMKLLATLVFGLLVCSCSSSPDTGSYGQAYRAGVTGLKPSKQVSVYIARSEIEKRNLEQGFLKRPSMWRVIGSTNVYGQYCDIAKVQELGRLNGADAALVYIGPTAKIRSQVSYYGPYPAVPYGYGNYSTLQPYQVAPPEGGLMDSVIRVKEYNRGVAERNQMRQIEDAKWIQVVVFVKRIP